MNHNEYDIAVIGGGIVGLATAMSLVGSGIRSLIVLEAEPEIATHQTGHNSGVVHSGLYYKPGSLKAMNCVAGRKALYQFCQEFEIPHEQCGKIVVATHNGEVAELDRLAERGQLNGLHGLKRLAPEAVKEFEPHVACVGGLLVPETGIVDFTEVSRRFAEVIEQNEGSIKTGARFLGVSPGQNGLVLETTAGEIHCRSLINCAGLQADRVARICGIEPELQIIPFRGEYYELSKESQYLVKNLIYPVPDSRYPFLGVHFTRMIHGGVEAGPNAVLALKREGYRWSDFSVRDALEIMSYKGSLRMAGKYWKTGVNECFRSLSKWAFLNSLRRLVPEITMNDISRGGAGVRAQAVAPDGSLVDDFRIFEAERMIHIINTPSPAATASISIGQTIAKLAVKNFKLGE